MTKGKIITLSSNALDHLPPSLVEAIWLGALQTVHAEIEPFACEAQRIITILEANRARVLDARPLARVPLAGWHNSISTPGLHIEGLRQALKEERKIEIAYIDGKGRSTKRIIWPLDGADFGPRGAMLAWCEKRQDFRNFRFDRICNVTLLAMRMPVPRPVLAAFASTVMQEMDGW